MQGEGCAGCACSSNPLAAPPPHWRPGTLRAKAHRTRRWEVDQSCIKERGVLALRARPGCPPMLHTCLLEPGLRPRPQPQLLRIRRPMGATGLLWGSLTWKACKRRSEPQDFQSQAHIFLAFGQTLLPNSHPATLTHKVPMRYLLCLAQCLRESPGWPWCSSPWSPFAELWGQGRLHCRQFATKFLLPGCPPEPFSSPWSAARAARRCRPPARQFADRWRT